MELYCISAEKNIKIHVSKICLVFLAWDLGWLFLCNGSVWHISASLCYLKRELKTDTGFWRVHHFTTSLQNNSRGQKYKEVKAAQLNSGKCFLYLTCCRASPKTFWVILQCHRAYSQSHFQHRSKIYSKISLWRTDFHGPYPWLSLEFPCSCKLREFSGSRKHKWICSLQRSELQLIT